MNDTQRLMYESLISVRNNEIELRWSRSQFFFLINSGVASLLVATDKIKIESISYGAICVVGIWLSLLWLWVAIASHSWVSYWDSMLAALEALDGEPIRVFRGEEWERRIAKKPSNNFVLILIVLTSTFIALWFILLIYWLYQRI